VVGLDAQRHVARGRVALELVEERENERSAPSEAAVVLQEKVPDGAQRERARAGRHALAEHEEVREAADKVRVVLGKLVDRSSV
jgi:hypothetical protein